MTAETNSLSANWLAVLQTFVERGSEITGFKGRVEIAPPLKHRRFEDLARKLPVRIPEAISTFLLEGSARCKFRYEWTPEGRHAEKLQAALEGEEKVFGGADFCNAAAFSRWLKDCKAWATETWLAEYPEDQAWWLNSLPIAAMPNGDYLSVDLREGKSDPPVVYLSHDDASRVISQSFAAFLEAWAGLCYIGPEIWMLESFLDEETGWLDSNTERAKVLRQLFRAA